MALTVKEVDSKMKDYYISRVKEMPIDVVLNWRALDDEYREQLDRELHLRPLPSRRQLR